MCVIYYPRSNGKPGTAQNRSDVLWFEPLENATSCNLIVHSLTWLIAACFLVSHFCLVFFFWGCCAFPAQSEIHSLNWNTAAAAHMVVFSSEEVKWWPTYKKLLALEETLFEHILQFVVLVWFCLLQAGKEGNCFISVNPNLAQLLCPNAWVSY